MQLSSSKIILINDSLVRVIKKFTIMSHPSHTGLFSYTSTYLQLVAVRNSASFQGLPSFSSYKRSAVAPGLKSSLITRKYTYFRKNRVQMRNVEAKFTAIHVAVTSFYFHTCDLSHARAHLLKYLCCRGLNTLDRIVCLPSVVACWLNG